MQAQDIQQNAELNLHVRVVHSAVAGRARLKVSVLYRAEELKRRIEQRLLKETHVYVAQANPLTASVLVYFDPCASVQEIAATLERELADIPPLGQPNRPPSRHPLRTALRKFKAYRRKQASNAAAPQSQDQTTGWHTLNTRQVLSRVGGSAQGLSSSSASRRLALYGANRLPQPTRRSDLQLFVQQFASPPIGLLGASAVVSVLTGGTLDAIAIIGVVLTNAVIGFFTERQSERTIALLGRAAPRQVSVSRDGTAVAVPVEQVVRGDLLILKPGTYVAADARLIDSERLSLDESALTGESLAVSKDAEVLNDPDTPLAERRNMVYSATLVTGGSGLAVVVGTGLNTEMGKIHSMSTAARPPASPVEKQLDTLGTQLALLSSAICAGVFVIGLLRGYGRLEMLKASISLAVAAVPEGLPTVATTTLALGIKDMQRRKVLIRRLDAVETLGSVQVLCLDKTGTLTLNRMAVVSSYVGTQPLRVEQARFFLSARRVEPLEHRQLRRFFEVIAICSETAVNGEAEAYQLDGTPTELALVELAIAAGIDVEALRRRYPRVGIQHRSEDHQYMVTSHSGPGEQTLLAIKGSPAQVLELCEWYFENEEIHRLDDGRRQRILRENDRMAGETLRVLGVACSANWEQDESEDMIWIGLAGMADPIRPGMDELLSRFHKAGIQTTMITGDQSATAYAIAKQLKLAEDRPIELLDSISLAKVDSELLKGVVQRVQVFARVSPAHKLQIVQALQGADKVVAMTGDGINDGPALKAADLGIAMGRSGTDIARSLADVVLEDDNLHTMEIAVRDGRTIYNNIRKAIRFLLSTNMSEIEVMTAGVSLGLGHPVNAMQLLWINLITDVFPALALAMEPAEPGVMDRPPRPPNEPIVRPPDLRRLGMESAVITTATMASYLYALMRYGSDPQARTHAFMTLTLAQLVHTLSSRSEKHTLFDRGRLPPNRYLGIAIGISVIAQALTVLIPALRRLLGTTPIGLLDTLVIASSAAGALLVNEGTKALGSKGHEKRTRADKTVKRRRNER